MNTLVYLLPAAAAAGIVLGVAGSRELRRGLLRGALNFLLIVGGMAVLALLVALTGNPAF